MGRIIQKQTLLRVTKCKKLWRTVIHSIQENKNCLIADRYPLHYIIFDIQTFIVKKPRVNL